jgi:hypothetical protein
MKTWIYGGLVVLVTVLSLPTTSDAFSRRSHSSEVGPTQATTAPLTQNGDDSAQSVPEPPVLLLMSVGLGVIALAFVIKNFQKGS